MLRQINRISRRKFPAFALVCISLLVLILSACVPTSAWLMFADEEQPHLISLQGETLGEVLTNHGFSIGENDRVLLDGSSISLEEPIVINSGATIQVRRAYPLTINDDGQQRTMMSSAPTLGQALWENGIPVTSSDYISIPVETVIDQSLELEIRRSNTLTILVDGIEIQGNASSETVGQALAQAGVSLQHLDYSQPAEDAPLPEDGRIQVIRVTEEVVLTEEFIPFEEEYVADAEMDLDQLKVIESGQAGLSVSRVRIRRENGEEVARETEAAWIAKAPVSQKTAYGTKITIQTTNTEHGVIEYWRAVTVTAHTYLDTGYQTASGKWPTYGMMAVSFSWWPYMKGQSYYVPGYGHAVVEDKCGACEGNMLIDLFIPTEDYVPWHKSVTLYFLTPVPASIKYVLP